MIWQPRLIGHRVRLQPLEEDDRESLYEVAKDPYIWEQHHCQRYLRSEYDQYFDESLSSGGAILVIDLATSQVIGSSRFNLLPDFPDGIEIGWSFLSRAYWGGKYNGEIKKLMIDYAFQHVRNVVFFVKVLNIRSNRALEKIGAYRVDHSALVFVSSGRPNTHVYLITRENWAMNS